MRILGIDPGSRFTGYGVVEEQSGRLIHVDCGVIAPSLKLSMAQRLSHITDGLERVIAEHAPDAASIEEVFSGRNWRSALKLGQARGAALVALAHHDLDVAEYTPTVIKKNGCRLRTCGERSNPAHGARAAGAA